MRAEFGQVIDGSRSDSHGDSVCVFQDSVELFDIGPFRMQVGSGEDMRCVLGDAGLGKAFLDIFSGDTEGGWVGYNDGTTAREEFFEEFSGLRQNSCTNTQGFGFSGVCQCILYAIHIDF